MVNKIVRGLGTAAVMSLCSLPALAQDVVYHAVMSPTSEVDPAKSTGSGTCDVTVNPATDLLTYKLVWQGESGKITHAHLHGPGKPGQSAPVAVVLNGTVSPVTGTATITQAQAQQIAQGLWYCNLHSTVNAKGEMRGQLMPAK